MRSKQCLTAGLKASQELTQPLWGFTLPFQMQLPSGQSNSWSDRDYPTTPVPLWGRWLPLLKGYSFCRPSMCHSSCMSFLERDQCIISLREKQNRNAPVRLSFHSSEKMRPRPQIHFHPTPKSEVQAEALHSCLECGPLQSSCAVVFRVNQQ